MQETGLSLQRALYPNLNALVCSQPRSDAFLLFLLAFAFFLPSLSFGLCLWFESWCHKELGQLQGYLPNVKWISIRSFGLYNIISRKHSPTLLKNNFMQIIAVSQGVPFFFIVSLWNGWDDLDMLHEGVVLIYIIMLKPSSLEDRIMEMILNILFFLSTS